MAAEIPDPSLAAARYRAERDTQRQSPGQPDAAPSGAEQPDSGQQGPAQSDAAAPPRRSPTADELRSIAKTALDRAIDAGEFDDLPLAGKPIPYLTSHDPDWWIKAKIEREGLSGVAPPALSLRTEDARLDALLDEMTSEASVRATVESFNARIVEARRQLMGGPPVVTPLRDLDEEVRRWDERRARRRVEAERLRGDEAPAPNSWRERRRAARAARKERSRRR